MALQTQTQTITLEVAPQVCTWGSAYLVVLPARGWDYGEPHVVYKNKTCSCGAPDCPAIEAVRNYLRAGGERAPDPNGKPILPGVPPFCPLCGADVVPDHTLSSPRFGAGWRCVAHPTHFWSIRAAALKGFFTSPDHPAKRGIPRMTPAERTDFLTRHRLNYPAMS